MGFAPVIAAFERPQTYALVRAATAIGRAEMLRFGLQLSAVLQ
jgi:hypothetical protein